MNWRRALVLMIPFLVVLLGLWLWWPWYLMPDRRSDLGATLVGGGIVAFAVLYLEQVLSQRQEKNILRLQLSTGTNFEGVDLSNQDLSGFYLPGKSFNHANLTGANLRGATLSGTSFIRTRLTGADLRGANLQNIAGSFGDAWLGVTSLEGVRYDSSTRWPEGREGEDRWPVGVDPKQKGAINLDEQGQWLKFWQWLRDTVSF